jgi:hypothetical protein
MKETTASDIERINIIILVLGSILSILIMRDFRYFFSFAVASAIMTMNFRFLRKIMEGVFGGSSINKRELLVKLPLKFFGLMGLIALIVIWGDIDVLFFVVGLTTVFFSLVINQIIMAFSDVRRKENGT